MEASMVRGFFADFPGLEWAIKSHCERAGIGFRHGDIEVIKPRCLLKEHLVQNSPITTGLEIPKSGELSPREVGRAYIVIKKDDGVTGGGYILVPHEIEISKGQMLLQAITTEERDYVTSVITIWTEIRVSFSGQIMSAKHWIEILHLDRGVEISSLFSAEELSALNWLVSWVRSKRGY